MNNASPQKPHRRRRSRLAAATAAALGATLLAYPGGTATAQTDIDCDALGDDPMAVGIASAFEAARACGFEVRIRNRSEPYSTLSVTPFGQLHLVATADPIAADGDDGTVDPTLMEFEGLLTQTASPWPFWLSHTDTTQPLFYAEGGALEWSGEKPPAAYTDTVAVYDELAAGLDLRIEVDAASAELRFTADDPDAWQALATGLVLEEHAAAVVDDALQMRSGSAPDNDEVRTTPFSVLDATGDFYEVGLELGGDALALSLPDGALDEVEFPLTVTTQWAYSGYGISEWGVVSSAAPDLAAYRGIGTGADASFLEYSGGNGDAGVGAYCDAFQAAADCTDTENAASYWNFHSPLKTNQLRKPSSTYQWSFPIDQATFSIDLAHDEDGTFTCHTPDLVPVEDYGAGVTWNTWPDTASEPVAASCEDEVVSYDVTAPVRTAWADETVSAEVAFGMTESDEMARFLGGSARLDVHFDIVGLFESTFCSRDPEDPDFTNDGAVHVKAWGADVIDLDLTWTAVVRDYATRQVVATTEPVPVPVEGGRVGTVPDGLPDGRYTVDYRIVFGNGFTHTPETCQYVEDNSQPEIIEVKVDHGPNAVGDAASVAVTVADIGFPDGINELTVSLIDSAGEELLDRTTLTSGTTADLEVQLTAAATRFYVQVEDSANNDAITTESLVVTATGLHRDYNGDRLQDLIAVRTSDGARMFYAGNGDGTFAAGVAKGTGWGGLDVTMAGDLTSDGKADLLARDKKTGTLYTYPGDGTGGLGSRITVGTGWNTLGAFTSAGDFNADRKLDLYAVDKADGRLYFYPGQGDGKFGARVALGTGWGVMDALAAVGDLDDDGNPDLLAHDSRTGQYYLYKGAGAGRLGTRVTINASLDGSGSDRYSQIAAVGDQDGDGKEDLVAVNARTGELELHSLNGDGTAVHAGNVIATGWGGNRLAAVNEELAYDYNGDGLTDFVARRNSDGTTYLYPGNGTISHLARVSWGTALNGMTLIATAGDMNGDGFSDVLARTSGGTLYLYPGAASGALNTAGRIAVGTGWNAMGAITAGHDYNADGKADLIAVASDGTLWFYPGKGDGTVGTRKSIGTSWTSMKEVTAAGDLDHDGLADMLAVRTSDGCLYFYGGKGDGTFKPMVKMSCGWSGYDSITAVGDFNRDGHADWMARRKSDGVLFLYRGNGAGNHSAAQQFGTGWNTMTLA